MMRSLFSGVSGLKVHQTKMDVIGNNISNVNTTGFKSGRVTFNEIFSQTLSGASGPNANTGRAGTNAMQVGLGVNVNSIDTIMTEGAAQRTDYASDLKIEGNGFFIVGDNNGKYFTRAGAFTLDKDGTLATAGGMKVYGWRVNASGQIQKSAVEPIEIMSPENMYNAPEMTKNITFTGNIFTGETGGIVPQEISFYDSLGNKFSIPVEFTYNSTDKKWGFDFKDVTYDDPADPTGATSKTSKVMYMNGDLKNPIELTPTGTFPIPLEFDTGGHLTAESVKGFDLIIPNTVGLPVNSTFGNPIKVDFSKITQYKDSSTVKPDSDGINAGTLTKYNVGPDGIVTGIYTNGTQRIFGQISVATFSNPAGLEKIGNNLFTPTSNSGQFDGVGQDPTASGGKLNSGVLEMSNVDLSSEFTEMITTQRGFQANSKIITTSDEMLQELVNLKR